MRNWIVLATILLAATSSFAVEIDCSPSSTAFPSDRVYGRTQSDNAGLSPEKIKQIVELDKKNKARDRKLALEKYAKAYIGYKWLKGKENKQCATEWKKFEDKNGMVHCQFPVTKLDQIGSTMCVDGYIQYKTDRSSDDPNCQTPFQAYNGAPEGQVCILHLDQSVPGSSEPSGGEIPPASR